MKNQKQAAAALQDAPTNPFASPVARLDEEVALGPHVEVLHSAIRDELRRQIALVGSTRRSVMLLIKGDPGQGKTHELAKLRETGGSFYFLQVPPLKDAGAPFQHVLRHVVQGLIAQKQLQPLLWEALRQVTHNVSDKAKAEGDDETVERLSPVVNVPPRFLGAFQTMARENRGVMDLVGRRGRVLPPLVEVDPDFGRVLCRLPDRDAEPVALDWLRGAELPREDLPLLGVSDTVDSEDRSFEILRSLVRITPRSLVLSLDQLESTSGLLGDEGVQSLFTALMEIYQQLPLCIVLSCQTQVWSELMMQIPQASRERIVELPPLAKPTVDEAIALVAARLHPTWSSHQVDPPYPTFPFGAAWLGDFVRHERPSVREVLLRCGAMLDDMRARGAVAEVTASVVPSVVGAESSVSSPTRVLAETHRRMTELPEELQTPELRQDRLRSAVVQLLRGALERQRPLGGLQVTQVEAPKKPRSGARPPIVVTLTPPGGAARRVGLEVNSDDARNAYRVIERLRDQVTAGQADTAVLVREAEQPLGASAKKTLELVKALEATGGGVVYLEKEAAHRLVAAELLLDAVAAAEVWIGQRAITREETLTYLLEHQDLGTTLVPLLRMPSAGSARARPQAAQAEELPDRILGLLRSTSPVMAQQRLAQALGLDVNRTASAVQELVRRGDVTVALDREKAPVVLLSRRERA